MSDVVHPCPSCTPVREALELLFDELDRAACVSLWTTQRRSPDVVLSFPLTVRCGTCFGTGWAVTDQGRALLALLDARQEAEKESEVPL